jgi:hypothetical protein
MLLVVVVGSTTGCSHELEDRLAAVTKDRDDVRTNLATRDNEVTRLQTELAAAQGENAKLTATPRFYYDDAVDKERTSDAADTDEADQAAVAAYDEVIRRFPTDPLSAEAGKRRTAVAARLQRRAAARRRAQAEVVQQIAVCKQNHAAAQASVEGSVRFTWNNEIDMNAMMARGRDRQPYDEAASAAKARAEELLKGGVSDPDGDLANNVSGCDR